MCAHMFLYAYSHNPHIFCMDMYIDCQWYFVEMIIAHSMANF